MLSGIGVEDRCSAFHDLVFQYYTVHWTAFIALRRRICPVTTSAYSAIQTETQ